MTQEEPETADVPDSTEAERHALMKEYVERWKRLGPLLEAQREEDVRRSETVSNIAAFGRLYSMALASSPPQPTSGLVEQQRLFSRIRRG